MTFGVFAYRRCELDLALGGAAAIVRANVAVYFEERVSAGRVNEVLYE